MSYRILLVEDEGLIRTTLTEALEDAGYEVVSAETGDEACTLLGMRDGFDVLVTDIQMPGSNDGLSVAKNFHKHHPRRPVLFMTGRPEMLSPNLPLAETEALLRKPFGPRQILSMLQTMLVRP